LTSHFQDGGHDVISRNKVLPPGEWTRSVCWRLCSSLSQFLILVIYNTFILVLLGDTEKAMIVNESCELWAVCDVCRQGQLIDEHLSVSLTRLAVLMIDRVSVLWISPAISVTYVHVLLY